MTRSRSARRSARSNRCWAPGSAAALTEARGAAAATTAVPCNKKVDESFTLVLADCGTSRYSIGAPVALSGNTAQPDVWSGSRAVSAAYT